jgi:SAM-dependent methyltransferase
MSEYDQLFFDNHTSGSSRSAMQIVPLVNNLIRPKSVLDLGSGIGEWLQVWQKIGIEDYIGIDGDYVNPNKLLIPRGRFLAHNLTNPLKLDRKFDLVMSLEVAEHLDKEAADIFVESLVNHSDVIFFSAAVPGQGGTHHVNEQWPSYWSKKFAVHGYQCFDIIRPLVWSVEGVEYWYRQNCMLFTTKDAAKRFNLKQADAPLDIAHPQLVKKLASPKS